ncbi:MAG: hypothetical protein OEM77_02795 [Nitrosopumilus sp.]|nr:hypothetical protein [Nitrosopumilus sp.]MDH3736876.1 hypothetical protein [Nitrosopumilus sp.]MDH3823994.1 hypothetical protein [Nitrosopumilus sp.]MDH3832621.1 hypothetical protein [Nitrosopumilus sp.]
MTSDPITDFLIQIGINTTSGVIHDILNRFRFRNNPTTDDLREDIISSLNLQGMEIKADKIIEFLAQNGNITITGTDLSANESINMFSAKNTSLSFGDDSTSKTETTAVNAKGDSQIVAKGGAGWKQNKDGSISFYT